jgi:hypothetical protein
MKKVCTYARPRPVIELDGTAFYIDADNRKLIQVGDPENEMDCLEMRSFGDHLELWYDPLIKNIYRGDHGETLPEHIQVYWFDSIDALDPAGASRRLDELNPDWRSELPNNVKGIDIAGRQFFVDKEDGCFREINNIWNSIGFYHIMRENKRFGLYINLDNHNVAFSYDLPLKHSLDELPGHIVFAKLPKSAKLKKVIKRYIRQTKKEPKYI